MHAIDSGYFVISIAHTPTGMLPVHYFHRTINYAPLPSTAVFFHPLCSSSFSFCFCLLFSERFVVSIVLLVGGTSARRVLTSNSESGLYTFTRVCERTANRLRRLLLLLLLNRRVSESKTSRDHAVILAAAITETFRANCYCCPVILHGTYAGRVQITSTLMALLRRRH